MALQVLLVLSAISLACAQLGVLEGKVEEYIPISGAQLQDLEFQQNPELLPLAATNERIFVEMTSAQSASIVREGVNVNMDCLPWLNSFPDRGGSGSIRWLMLQRDENGIAVDPEPQLVDPTPLDQIETSFTVVGGELNRWYNITSALIAFGAEDTSFGDYICNVCFLRGTPSEECHNATMQLHILGAPPMLVKRDVFDGPGGARVYDIGANFCLNPPPAEERIFLLCPILEGEGIPQVVPAATRTWVKDGVVIYSGEGSRPFNNTFLMSGNNSLFMPGLITPPPLDILILSRTGGIAIDTDFFNVSVPSMLPPGVTEANYEEATFQALLGDYMCSVNNVYGGDSGKTTISNCATSDAQEDAPVLCYASDTCSGAGVQTTQETCCNNLVEPVGFSFTTAETCQRCPVVLGFSPANFSGIEQGQAYAIQAGYLSGRPPVGGILNMELKLGTADASDVSASRTQIGVFSRAPLSTNVITLNLDDVSQEFNETFSMEFSGLDLTDTLFFPSGVPVTVNHLNGTIIDGSRINLDLTEDDIRAFEGRNAHIEVGVAKGMGRLANPVRLRLTPLTVIDAERRGILNFTRPPGHNNFSPIFADTNDFNATALEVTFPTDEQRVEAFVRIFDDEINEASEQVFVVLLEIVDAVNPDLIVMFRSSTVTCRILDNDGINIGFAQQMYSFNEPAFEELVREVTLVKEGNRQTEQTFAVNIVVSDPTSSTPPATLDIVDPVNFDYSLGNSRDVVTLLFPNFVQNITFNFLLYNNDFPEGTEGFLATSAPAVGDEFPQFGLPQTNTVFEAAEILILQPGVQTRVGFQQSSYTVREASGRLEVCVEVFTPQQDEELVSDISLIVESETSTAGNSDFTDVGQHPVLFTALEPRLQCLDVGITNDNLAEGTETFSLILKQDPLLGSTGVVIEPNVAEITILDDSSDTCPGGLLFFELNGVAYEPNSIIVISELGTSTTSSSVTDPGSSLVCMTESVNTECCRNSDGGNIGEWVYPDGSMVPRNSNSQGSDFSRSGFTHQIRLNRLTDSLAPVGTYMCVVPPQAGCGNEMHVASVQLVLPVPGEMLSLCPITAWGPPRGPFGDYTGYDLRYFIPDGNEMVINKRGNEFFQLVTDEVRSLGPLEDMLVQVRARAGSHVGPYTRAAVVCPMDFVPN